MLTQGPGSSKFVKGVIYIAGSEAQHSQPTCNLMTANELISGLTGGQLVRPTHDQSGVKECCNILNHWAQQHVGFCTAPGRGSSGLGQSGSSLRLGGAPGWMALCRLDGPLQAGGLYAKAACTPISDRQVCVQRVQPGSSSRRTSKSANGTANSPFRSCCKRQSYHNTGAPVLWSSSHQTGA